MAAHQPQAAVAAIRTCSCECGAAAAAINVPVILEIPIGEDVKAMLNLLFGRSVGKETLVSGFCDNIGGICVGVFPRGGGSCRMPSNR